MAKTTIFLVLLSTLIAFLAAPSAAEENNVLLTGDVLQTDSSLSTPDATFVIQDDCNLVLYGGRGFQSNTHGNGIKCSVTLNDFGQLVINDIKGETVWKSPTSGNKQGKYVAVLRPDSEVAIYGPMVWESHSPPSSAHARPRVSTAMKNLMFSGEILPSESQLITRDYRFIMRSDCNLALVKAGKGDFWSTNTRGNGEHCFARLGHDGELTVVDDHFQKVWSSRSNRSATGEYVLVLQINGQAAIYGPMVWSTATNRVLTAGFAIV